MADTTITPNSSSLALPKSTVDTSNATPGPTVDPKSAMYVALAKAIAKQESGGDPNKSGDAGTSYGMGQWNNLGKPLAKGELPAVWKDHAKIVLGDANAQMTPENQKAVLTGMVKYYADQGLQPYEIAAKWNSGSEKGWENKVGTTTINGQQVKYDTPSYVKNVDKYFKANLAEAGGSATPDASTAAPTGPFKFDVPAPVDTRTSAEKIAQYQKEQEGYDAEAKKANSFGGILGNTLKGIGETIASSEIGLGKTIAKTMGTKNLDTYVGNVQTLNDSNIKLLKLIKDKEAKGEDTTNLKRTFNSNVDLIEENKKAIEDYGGSLPTNSEALGQIGGTALDVLTAGTYGKEATAGMKTGKLAIEGPKTAFIAEKTGIPASEVATKTPAIKAFGSLAGPEVGKIAESSVKPTGLFTKEGIKTVAKGAGIGYAQDVTQGMQGARGEDRTGAKAFIPGMGTVIGGGIPLVTEGAKSIKNVATKDARTARVIESRKKELDILDNYKSVDKVVGKNRARGIDVKDIVANTDLLHGAVDKNGTIITKGEGNAVDQVQQFIKPQEDVISKSLQKEGTTLPLAVVKKKLMTAVNNSGLEGAALVRARNEVEKDIAGYKLRSKGGEISLAKIHDAKVDKYSNINFMTEPEKQKSAKAIAKALKELVEDNAKSVEVKKINGELARHYAVIDYLEKLDGKKVEGGRLGKYFAKTVGAMVGGHFGPLGAIAGAETAGALKGRQFEKTFGKKIGKTLEQSDTMKKAVFGANSRTVPVNSVPEFNYGRGANPKLKSIIPSFSAGSKKPAIPRVR